MTATSGTASATVNWTAPDPQGSPITSYTVTPFVGSTPQVPVTVSGSPPATSALMAGLTDGTTYTFQVTATNAVGTSAASAPSAAVTPADVPNPPAAVTAVTAGSGSLSVSWTPQSERGVPDHVLQRSRPYAGSTAGTPVTVTGSPAATSTTVHGAHQRYDATRSRQRRPMSWARARRQQPPTPATPVSRARNLPVHDLRVPDSGRGRLR